LALNVGSRTFEGGVKGIWDHALTTRPINELLPKISKKEIALKEQGIIPIIAICGAGAAGTELAFGFKARWEKFFGQEIKVTLIGRDDKPVPEQADAVRNQILRKLKEHNISFIGGKMITEIKSDGVQLNDGSTIPCNVPIWATGAQP
jgi:NADH dehydrogenase FAD-containing subunit